MSNEQDRQDLISLAAGLAELEARYQDCPVAAFKPHSGQRPFIESTAPIVVAMAGNRWGKTHVVVAELIAAALGYRPWLVPDFKLDRTRDGLCFPPRNQVPSKAWVRRVDGLPIRCPAKVVVVSGLSLARGIGEIVQEKFTALWPRQVKFKTYLGPLGVWQKIQLPNGSEIYFGSATQANLAWEGFAADLVVADEPIPKRVFTALRRGLIDRKGQFKWSMTPLGDANIAWVAADIMSEDRTDVEIIRGTSWANPYLDKEALQNFLDDPTLTQEERRARETGEVAAIGRRIVTTFSDKCVIPPTDLPSDVPRFLIVDPHHARAPAMIWLAVMDDGERLVAYREWPEQDFEKMRSPSISLHDIAGTIKTLEGKEEVRWRLCDPLFGVQHAKVHGEQFRSFVEEMATYGLYFDARVDNDIDRGILKLRDAFRISPTTKRPRLEIMRNCRNAIRAMNFWCYEDSPTGGIRVSEHFKDFADVLRYGVMYDLPICAGKAFNYIDDEDEE